ncbi:BTB/POZ domain-containing protein At1g04390-like isoform X4 [Vitis riparia]|nr:BTB/POZ domain-containing protein At1g04390-like isoform X4 [Vitis riparia]
MQKHVVHSISAFLGCISAYTCQDPLVKDTVADMIKALEGILQCNSDTVLIIAAKVALKLVRDLPSSLLQSHVLHLIQPFSSLLSSHQVKVASRCANGLNHILSYLSLKEDGVIWEILKETNAVIHIINNIQIFSKGMESIKHFQRMASLLRRVLWRWPPSRYHVWNDAELLRVLEAIRVNPDSSVKVAVLQLYSALALCGNGAERLLENGENLLKMVVQCMDSTQPPSVRIEAFKLAQLLAMSEQRCSKMMRLCCEPIVKAIICGLKGCGLSGRQFAKDRISLLVEAGHLALITRWAGEHHIYFWKLGIAGVLSTLLLRKSHKAQQPPHSLSMEELTFIADEGSAFIWEIIVGLVTHCGEDFNPEMNGNDVFISILICCACMTFVESVDPIFEEAANNISSCLASRALLMMIYSPCKYIASQAQSKLSKALKAEGKRYLKSFTDYLCYVSSRDEYGRPDERTFFSIVGLTCYSGLPQYQKYVLQSEGIKMLLAFIKQCLKNDSHLGRLSFASNLQNIFSRWTCCQTCAEDWDGGGILMLFGLWGLAELIHHSGRMRNHPDLFRGQMEYTEVQFINKLQEICSDTSIPGLRWYAAYLLSYFGVYGFPSRLGKRIGNALGEKENTDMQLILKNGESVSIHGVVLMVQCPSLLQTVELPLHKESSDGSSVRQYTESAKKFKKEVHLSSHLRHQPLVKLLEFVYLGYLQAGEDLVKSLKSFAKHCKLQPLLQMLHRNRPKWGMPFPGLDLALALDFDGHTFSDVALEAEATEVMQWTCKFCSVLVPHMHVHKVILWSSCDHFRAMFRSGMQESRSPFIKVPVSWEALVKLVDWLYSDKLPTLVTGCLWDNMDERKKLKELQPYLELCWLADYWLLDDIQEHCSRVINSCLDSSGNLSLEVLQIAARLSLWKLAETAVNRLGPSYSRLRLTGEIEKLDKDLADMVRVASVRHSQDSTKCKLEE